MIDKRFGQIYLQYSQTFEKSASKVYARFNLDMAPWNLLFVYSLDYHMYIKVSGQ